MYLKSSPDNDLSDIALDFAGAAIDSSLWAGAMEKLNTRLGGVCCALEIADLKTGEASMVCSIELGADRLKEYEERVFHINPRVKTCGQLPVGVVADDRTLMDPEDPHAPEFLDWLEKTPYYYIRGGKILDRDSQVAFFSCNYAKSHGLPDEDDAAVHRLLLPHLVQVMSVGRAFAESAVRSSAPLEYGQGPDQCFLLLDARGAVTHCSAGMADVLTVRHGRLAATAGRDRPAVERLVASVMADEAALKPPVAIRVTGRTSQLGVVLRALRLPPRQDLFQVILPRAIITLTDLDAPARSRRAELQVLFGLTAREADVCALIGRGLMPEAVAHQLSIRVHTVREHLKNIYAKVGVTRQAELALAIQRLSQF